MSKKAAIVKENKGAVFTLIICLFPLLYLTYFQFIYDPTNVPRFLIASAILLGAVWFIKDIVGKTIPVKAVAAFLLAFYVWSLISVFWSQNGAESIFQTQKHFLFVFTILLFGTLGQRHHEIPVYIARSLLFLVPIILLVFIREVSTELQHHALDQYTMYKMPGLSAHKNLLSAYLFFMSSFFILGYFTDHTSWKKIYLPALTTVLTIILILLTRAVYIALFAYGTMMTITIVYIKIKSKQGVQLKAWKNIIFSLLISVIMAIGFYASFSQIHYAEQQANPKSYAGSTSANERFALWYYSARMFLDHPVAGVGAGNWKMIFPANGVNGLYRAQYENIVFLQPHNDYFWTLCELGLAGFLLFGIPLFIIFRKSFKSLPELKDDKQITLLLLICTIAGWAAISFFDFPKERTELILFSGSCLGLAYGFTTKSGDKVLFSIPGNIFKITVSALLILNIVMGFYRLSSESHFIELNKYLKQNNQQKVIVEAEKANNIFVQMDPFTSPFDIYIARAQDAMGRKDLALTNYESAVEISPYCHSCLDNLGGSYVANEQYEKAIPFYLKAQHICPDLDDDKFNLSYTYAKMKQYDLAIEWANKVKKNMARKEAFLKKIDEMKNGRP